MDYIVSANGEDENTKQLLNEYKLKAEQQSYAEVRQQEMASNDTESFSLEGKQAILVTEECRRDIQGNGRNCRQREGHETTRGPSKANP